MRARATLTHVVHPVGGQSVIDAWVRMRPGDGIAQVDVLAAVAALRPVAARVLRGRIPAQEMETGQHGEGLTHAGTQTERGPAAGQMHFMAGAGYRGVAQQSAFMRSIVKTCRAVHF